MAYLNPKTRIPKAQDGLGNGIDAIPDMGGGRTDMGDTTNPKKKPLPNDFLKNLLNSYAGAAYALPDSTIDNPDILSPTIKQGLMGFQSGGILGGLIGAGAGLIQGSRDEQIYAQNQHNLFKNRLDSTANIDKGNIPMLKDGGGNASQNTLSNMSTRKGEEKGVLIQAQRGEKMMTPSGDIFDVKAQKLHKEMKPDEVTDYLEPGGYVFSDTLKLSKAQADKITLAEIMPNYSDKYPQDYEEIKMSSIFTKDDHTFAELAQRIKDTFPLNDNDKDAFAISANAQNKNSRLTYLSALVQLNEAKKPKDKQAEALVPKAEGGLGILPKFKPGNYLDVLTPDDSTYDESVKNQLDLVRKQGGDAMMDMSFGERNFNRPPLLEHTYQNPFVESSVFGINKNSPNVLDGYQSNLSTLRSPEETQIQLDRRGDIYNGELLPQRNVSNVNSLNPAFPGTIGGLGTSSVETTGNPLVNGTNTNPNQQPSSEDLFLQSLRGRLDKSNQQADKDYQDGLTRSAQDYKTNKNYLGFSTLASLIGNIGQNPQVDSAQLNQSYINQLPQGIPQSNIDYASARINRGVRPLVRGAFENNGSFSQAMSSLSTIPGSIANAQSDLAYNTGLQNIQLKTNFLKEKSNIVNQQILGDNQAINQTRSNANRQLANVAGVGVNYFNNRAALLNAYRAYDDKLKAQKSLTQDNNNSQLTSLEIYKQFT